MGSWIVSKNKMGPINSSKYKLNNKIILIFHHNPNAHLNVEISLAVTAKVAILDIGQNLLKFTHKPKIRSS